MTEAIIWVLKNLMYGVVNFFGLFTNPEAWPDVTNNAWIGKLIYYGGSVEFFFIVFDIFLIIFIIGIFKRNFLWAVVRGIEKLNNTIGRWSAWALLLMVIQQTMIVALQRIFRVSEITIGPFGYAFTKDLSWFAEELKLYNAIIVTLCCAYTFVQGGHVRVDLVYGAVRFRLQRFIDMLGALFFILPFMTFVWMFGWYFMWRHLMRGPIAYNKDLTHYERISKILKWNVETIAFSPNGFNAYFLFKVLLVLFAGLMFIQGMAFFFRSFLELMEGKKSEDKYLDHDRDHEPDQPVLPIVEKIEQPAKSETDELAELEPKEAEQEKPKPKAKAKRKTTKRPASRKKKKAGPDASEGGATPAPA